MSQQQRTIAVIGATGVQGNGLIQAILQDPERRLTGRMVVRNTLAPKVHQAIVPGATGFTYGDIDDVNTLISAFHGAHGVFAVTPFWAHMSADLELQQAKNIAEACKITGVKHVVWSTLEDTRKMGPADMPNLQGRFRVPHFDAKAEADEIFIGMDLPLTRLRTSFYYDNLINFGMAPKPNADGQLAWSFPMGNEKMAIMAGADIGRCAHGIFLGGNDYLARCIGVMGDMLTIDQMGEILSSELGVGPIKYVDADPDAYRSSGGYGAMELGNMFQAYRDFPETFAANRNIELARHINPGLQSFREWVAANSEQLRAAMGVNQTVTA